LEPDGRELKVAAADVKQQIAAAPTSTATPYVKKDEGLYGDPIRGGDSFDKPVPVPTGKLFHLDHTQPINHNDFFSVPVRGGQTLVVTVTKGKKEVGYGGATISDATRKQLVHQGEVSDKHLLVADFGDQQDGTYYVLIGSDYGDMHEDDTFQVDLVNNYDADSDRAAGKDQSRALEIKPGTYLHNYLSEVRPIAVFKLKAQGGKNYQFKARPAKSDGSIDLSAVNDDGIALGSASSPNKGAVATLDKLTLAKDGYIYVTVKYGEWSSKQGNYGIAFGEGDVESPHPDPEQ